VANPQIHIPIAKMMDATFCSFNVMNVQENLKDVVVQPAKKQFNYLMKGEKNSVRGLIMAAISLINRSNG
jgi:hypothetical protein